MYKSTKVIDGFSTCFRQHGATDSHCSYLHGYALKFKITFYTHVLDSNNWVMDFGFTKEQYMPNITWKQWFSYMFDHTTIIAQNDPKKELFEKMQQEDLIQLRVVDKVGCEAFAKLVADTLNNWLKHTERGVFIESVECIENEKNSAIFIY